MVLASRKFKFGNLKVCYTMKFILIHLFAGCYVHNHSMSQSLLLVQTSSDGNQNEVRGATSASYMLSVDDIGFLISVSCEPVRNDWARGPIVISEQIGPIVPGKYISFHLHIGQFCEDLSFPLALQTAGKFLLFTLL